MLVLATIVLILCLVLLSLFFLFDISELISGFKFKYFKSMKRFENKDYFLFIEDSFEQNLPFIERFIGAKYVLSFIFPSLLIFIAFLALGQILTSKILGIILTAVFSLAYISRIFLHLSINHRKKILSQLNRVCLSIRNYLSTGMVMDKAILETINHNEEKPIGRLLKNFIKLSESDLIEKFPLWFSGMEKLFFIPELSNSRQLLSLELKYNHNQEDAFLNAALYIQQKEKWIKKQSNFLNIALIVLDFLVLAFLGLLFFIIPNLSINPKLNWWLSSERPLVVFYSAFLIGFIYLVAVIFGLRRQF